MTKKPVVQVTKPASSLCNGQVNRAARAAIEAKIARISQAVTRLKKAMDAVAEPEEGNGGGG